MDSSEAVGQLGRLKTKVTFRTALNQIEKGLETAAKRAGVTKADLEDLSVPTYGFDQTGTRREAFGESAGVATLTPGGEITIAWFAANDKPVKAPTADAKKNFAAELKAFKADMDAAGKMLTAQKSRFDGFYLPERVWKLKDWRERFGRHPLLAHLCGRLIWHFSDADDKEKKAQGLWSAENENFADVDGQPIAWLTDETEVRLWHPIGFEVDAVLAWREALQKANIVQPFKQAHREVYLLTEAELRTEIYSNRFAGHILKQHQMNSLAALRGWKNQLRLMVDDSYPPATREAPELGLRAEFWIEGVGDNYGTDTTESGSYLYLATDQVRFYRTDAPVNTVHAGGGAYTAGWGANAQPSASLSLVDVPALFFSEIMRDVDMFVGVCSVGNDPQWQDGGPQGRYRDYWTDYSFGDLSATAQTRREVLAKLLPRLKIASRASLTDKFLTVRGDIRTYKIHLGSGNILMEPNDQYLCIVQGSQRGQKRGAGRVSALRGRSAAGPDFEQGPAAGGRRENHGRDYHAADQKIGRGKGAGSREQEIQGNRAHEIENQRTLASPETFLASIQIGEPIGVPLVLPPNRACGRERIKTGREDNRMADQYFNGKTIVITGASQRHRQGRGPEVRGGGRKRGTGGAARRTAGDAGAGVRRGGRQSPRRDDRCEQGGGGGESGAAGRLHVRARGCLDQQRGQRRGRSLRGDSA